MLKMPMEMSSILFESTLKLRSCLKASCAKRTKIAEGVSAKKFHQEEKFRLKRREEFLCYFGEGHGQKK